MRKLKILHVTNRFYPCVGGVEQNVLDICLQLRKRGYIADVLCLNKSPDGKKLPEKSVYKNINIFRLPFIDLKYYKITKIFLGLLKDYDVVHVHGLGYFSDLLALTKWIHKKPLVLSTHGGIFHTGSLGPAKKIYFNKIQKMHLKRFDKIVAVSKEDEKLFSRIVPKGKLALISNGIDYEKYSALAKAKKNPNLFVTIGRISKNKRLDNLIKAFSYLAKENRSRKLYIIGEDFDNLVPDLRYLVKKLNIWKNVIFTGKVTESKKIKFLKSAGYFLSASEYEGFGISVLEAIAAGCVPLLNSIQPFRSMAGNNLVDYSNTEAASKKIKLLARLKINKNIAKKYDWETIAVKWEKLYNSLAN